MGRRLPQNLGPLIKVSDLDGIHYEASQHAILAKAITAKVRELAG